MEKQKLILIPYGSRLKVKQGQYVEAGDEINRRFCKPT